MHVSPVALRRMFGQLHVLIDLALVFVWPSTGVELRRDACEWGERRAEPPIKNDVASGSFSHEAVYVVAYRSYVQLSCPTMHAVRQC